MKRGRSLVNTKNRVGPKIEPCGTPDFTYMNAARPFPWTTACCLSLRYDINQAIDLCLNLYFMSNFNRIEQSTTPKAFLNQRIGSLQNHHYLCTVSTDQSTSRAQLTTMFWWNPDGFYELICIC